MSVRLFVLSALTVASAFPAGLVAQERQPLPRPKIYIEGGDGPEVIRDRIRKITERRARLGVNVDLRAVDDDSGGARIESVTPGGPAAKAGIRSEDIVTRIGDKQVGSGMHLVEIVAQLKPEQTVSVEYLRDGTRKTVSLVTGNEPVYVTSTFDGSDFPGVTLRRSPFGGGVFSSDRLPGGGMQYEFMIGGPLADLELAPLNADLGAYFGTTEGVLVINVPRESMLGLKAGDVILNVDGRKATGPGGFLRILRSYEPGDTFKLEIMRNKARTTVTGQLEKGREQEH